MLDLRIFRNRGAWLLAVVFGALPVSMTVAVDPPAGFVALFNGTDLTGWKGLVGNPISRAAMSSDELAAAQATADARMRAHWSAVGTGNEAMLVFDGAGDSLVTARDYGDFELYVEWRIEPAGDSGIYLRGSPQVQIWDHPLGSGGLYNNQNAPSHPLARADRPVGSWNRFHVIMRGPEVTVWLNEVLVVDRAILENYWDRSRSIFERGPIELQNHGNTLRFRNIFLREIARDAEGVPQDSAAPALTLPEVPWGHLTAHALTNGDTRLDLHVMAWPGRVVRVPGLLNEPIVAYVGDDPRQRRLPVRRVEDSLEIQVGSGPPSSDPVIVLEIAGVPAVLR